MADGASEPGNCNADCTLASSCGDGVVGGSEDCDLGEDDNTGAYGGCNADCTHAARCGDGDVSEEEQCDEGEDENTGSYDGCNENCTSGPTCGDGATDPEEECDDGSQNVGGYGGCDGNCELGPFCGDGIISDGEDCDPNAPGASDCSDTCGVVQRCGDGMRTGDEECDLGDAANDGSYGGCTETCELAARCGDGATNGAEQCDLGTTGNTGAYGGCNANCTHAPRCGDSITNGSEACDLGSAGNTGAYGGCNSNCTKPAHCGDGTVNGPEECDLGTAANTGAYDGCNSNCTDAAYCGDGARNGTEECDEGDDNVDGTTTPGGGCNTSCEEIPECLTSGQCSGATPICGPDSTCVECTQNTHCVNADESRCVDGACEVCRDGNDLDCSHISGATRCFKGERCSECSPVGESGSFGDTCSGSNVCHADTGSCTSLQASSLDICGHSSDYSLSAAQCVSTAQCMSPYICVPHTFSGTLVGNFCMPPTVGGNCNTNYMITGTSWPTLTHFRKKVSLQNVEGENVDVCIPNATTCEGLKYERSQVSCSSDSECGAPNVNDAVCVSNVECHPLCISNTDCVYSGGCATLNGVKVCPSPS